MSDGWGSITDSCHKAMLELAEVLKNWNPPVEEPVENNPSLELLKNRLEESHRIRDLKTEALAKIIKFVTELEDVVVYPKEYTTSIKFRECVIIGSDRVILKEGRNNSVFIEFTSVQGVSEKMIVQCNGVTVTEERAIELILNWLVERDAKLPKLKE